MPTKFLSNICTEKFTTLNWKHQTQNAANKLTPHDQTAATLTAAAIFLSKHIEIVGVLTYIRINMGVWLLTHKEM